MTTKPGYKQTEIGEIPQKWKVVSLGKILREVNKKVKNLKSEVLKTPVLSMTRYSGLILQSEKFGKRVASKNLENYKLVEKRRVSLPNEIDRIFRCSNPDCISNSSEHMNSIMDVIDKENLVLKCRYCSRILDVNKINYKRPTI